MALRAPARFPAAPDLWGDGMVTFWPLSLTGQAFIGGVVVVKNHLAVEWESASVSAHEKELYFLGGGDKSWYTHFSHL